MPFINPMAKPLKVKPTTTYNPVLSLLNTGATAGKVKSAGITQLPTHVANTGTVTMAF
jgi:hypothetical protein